MDFAVTFIQKYKNYDEKELEKLRYGLEGIYLTFIKTAIILVIAFMLGIFKQVLLILLFFNIIRYTGFGFHADKSYQCLILSIIYFLTIPIFYIYVPLPSFFKLTICILCIISFILFAPADTPKRPLPNKKKRKIRKLLTVFIGGLYSIIIFAFPTSILVPSLLSSLTIEAIIIQPLFYKVFKQPYNNYKTYTKGLNT